MIETNCTKRGTFAIPSPFSQSESARRKALEELFSCYSAMLYKVALRKLGNQADAEDAVQDALLSAYKHLDQFKGNSHISTWLTSIVLNSARMQLRRRSSNRLVPLDMHDARGLDFSETFADDSPDPEEILRKTQLREVLERSMVKLSPRIRAAFRLRVVEGLSTREAAERLGISEGTLKARLFRALKRITPVLRVALAPRAKRDASLATARIGLKEAA
ncbi:MAG: sigma-70 family RNA polymerase sigma factor [Candidatus Acidiferrum sp.]